MLGGIGHRISKWKKRRLLSKLFPSSVVDSSCVFDKSTLLEGENLIRANVNIKGTRVGFGTYINFDSSLPNAQIGRYCSIGIHLQILQACHPLDFCSTYPGFYDSQNDLPFGATKGTHFDERLTTQDGFSCKIGNDVWIGANAVLKGGIVVGDGAVIGAGALVTKNVPPYAIVGGVPAHIIRYRFPKKTIEELIKVSWWNWNPAFIKLHRASFVSPERIVELFPEANQ